jgi:hypothetical protein
MMFIMSLGWPFGFCWAVFVFAVAVYRRTTMDMAIEEA